MNIYGEYFFGNKISDYGLEHGFVDYGTLAKAFNHVLNNDIMSVTENAGFYWEQVAGFGDENAEEWPEVFQWFIVPGSALEILEDAGEIVFYCADLDMYLWGVTHWGTSWDYVLTDIPCNTGKC